MAAPLSVMRHATLRLLGTYRTNSKLIFRLCSSDSSDGTKSGTAEGASATKSQLDLAKPGRARLKAAAAEKPKKHIPGPDEEGLDREVVTAVDAVAAAVGKDSQKLRSDLLKKLKEQQARAVDAQNVTERSSVRSMLAGMKVEKTRRVGKESTSIADTRRPDTMQRPRMSADGTAFDKRRSQVPRKTIDIRLFEGPSLGIFNKKSAASADVDTSDVARTVTLFDVIEEEERERLLAMPPNNAFEEMIRWTKEGKLWKFPIDNDQGRDDEEQVGFHEHIFLEQYLDDFPKKGPIRHFMELVVVGLSKNPFYTVQEKHEVIAWYAEYFKDKYHLIGEEVPSDNLQKVENKA